LNVSILGNYKLLKKVNMDKKNNFQKENIRLTVSAIFITLLFFLLGFSPATAENVITSGTSLKVLSGTTFVSSETLVIKSGAILSNAGTVILKKGLTNENTTPNTVGTGTVECSGTANQTFTGQSIIQNLTVNNAFGITVGGNTGVNGILAMTNGLVDLGSNNLLLGPAATVVGTPSSTIMIIVTGTGELRKEFPASFTGIFTFPVGDNTNTPEYSPVALNFTSGSFASGNYVGVNLVNEKYPDPNITGNYLNRFWNVTQSGITNITCNATFQYVEADVSGTENLLCCSMVNPAPLTTYSLTNSTTHVLSANGITLNGSYTGLKSTTTPYDQQLANITVPNETTICFDATQMLTVAGNGNTFLIENGGSVTLIAGNNIFLLPGTTVQNGGYLHGYITTDNNYCGSIISNMLVANLEKDVSLPVELLGKNHFIKIYPNPTADIVIVELIESGTNTTTNITVYNIQGRKLLQQTTNGELKYQFSLSGKPNGLYMVHVQSGDRSEIAKVIKN
jgi:hypothetical protein